MRMRHRERVFRKLCQSSLLFAFCGALAAQAQPPRISHEQAVARARGIVAKMTLDEKIEEIHGIHDATNYRVIPAIPRLGIPALHMTNGPEGPSHGAAGLQPPATAMPSPLALAASWDPALAFEYGKVEAEETRSVGSQLLEGPDVNIARVPQGGRTFESFGEDPYLSGRIAVGAIDGIQSTGIMADVKHYLANNQENHRFTVNEIIDERALREIYMPAFEAAIKDAHSATVMCAYPKVNGTYNCENAPLLNGVLKKEWGFDGFVISDWGATHSGVPSALAGLDLEMPTGHYFGQLGEAVKSGQLPVSVIDGMLVRRFAKMIEFGDFGPQPAPTPIPAFRHGAISRNIAEQSMVLLKNDGNILPLDPSQLRSIALIGPYAVRARSSGEGSAHVIPIYSIAPDDALNAAIDLEHTHVTTLDGADLDAAVAAARRASVAIVMVGDIDTEGRDQSLDLPESQNELVAAVAKANPRTIVVLKTGSAVLMPWLDNVAAVLEAWYPGEEDGRAVDDVLLGKVNPSGKLPLTFPRSVSDTLANNPEQYPGTNGAVHYTEGLNVGYRGYLANNVTPLFPFGFGLSYTQFSFGDLAVKHSSGSAEATVTFRVTNTGQRAGAEVAQLYLGFPPIAEGNEPPMQLKGFRKVLLKPGESKTIALHLDARSFSYWSEKSHSWQVAHGAFTVLAGDSVANTPLKTTVAIP